MGNLLFGLNSRENLKEGSFGGRDAGCLTDHFWMLDPLGWEEGLEVYVGVLEFCISFSFDRSYSLISEKHSFYLYKHFQKPFSQERVLIMHHLHRTATHFLKCKEADS